MLQGGNVQDAISISKRGIGGSVCSYKERPLRGHSAPLWDVTSVSNVAVRLQLRRPEGLRCRNEGWDLDSVVLRPLLECAGRVRIAEDDNATCY